MTEKKQKEFSKIILRWGEKNSREFPWRTTKNPYHVFVAEQLLRKTTVLQVQKVYGDFLRKYPSLEELVFASEDELKILLKPLGIENVRTQLFKKSAKKIITEFNGMIPSRNSDLLKVPGIGQYTANAILSMIYEKDVPMVDTNAIRVISRIFSYTSSKKRLKDDKQLWNFVEHLIPKGYAKQFNLAIIDFANAVCRAKQPQCTICPMIKICDEYQEEFC